MPALSQAVGLLGVLPIGGICLIRLITIALNARSWQLLLPAGPRPGFFTLFRLRWIGESVNNLLPVAQVGGDLARASLVARRGVPRAEAAATMMADLAIGVGAQIVFGLGGAVALARLVPSSFIRHGVWADLVAGLVILALAALAVALLFRFGALRVVAGWFARSKLRERWGKLAGGLRRLDRALARLLRRERALAASFAWHLAGWLSQVGETWLLLWMFNSNVSFRAAFAIEALASAARAAAFFVPSGVGVQELTIISISRLVGVDMEHALALGITKRAREVLVGVPGLVAWMIERKRWPKTDKREDKR